MTAAHAPLAPSSAHIWAECPGSVQMQAAHPEPDDSPAAREGTAAHWYVTEAIQGHAHPLGAIAPNGEPITQEMIDCGEGLIADVRDTMAAHPNALLRVEQTVLMPIVHDQNWGTPDVVLIDVVQKWVAVWDYKFGHRYVPVAENLQLIDYAIGVLQEMVPCADWPDWRVSLNIAQPRNYHASGPMREWRTDGRALLDEYVPRLFEAAREAMGPSPALRTNEHCRDCSARFNCPALWEAGGLAMDMTDQLGHVDATPHALGLQLRAIDDAMKRLDALKTGLEETALGMIRGGQTVPFFTTEYTTGREKWTVEPDEAFALGDMLGVDLRKKPDAITPNQARTALKKAGLDGSVIDAYADRPRGALRLARVDDNAAKLAFGE